MDETIQRILSLIDNSGLSDTQILRELKVSSSSTLITDWRKGRSKSPQIKHVLEFAKFFNVSTDFLLTGVIQSSDLSKDEIELLQHFRTLPDAGKERVIGYVEGHLDALKNPPN